MQSSTFQGAVESRTRALANDQRASGSKPPVCGNSLEAQGKRVRLWKKLVGLPARNSIRTRKGVSSAVDVQLKYIFILDTSALGAIVLFPSSLPIPATIPLLALQTTAREIFVKEKSNSHHSDSAA